MLRRSLLVIAGAVTITAGGAAAAIGEPPRANDTLTVAAPASRAVEPAAPGDPGAPGADGAGVAPPIASPLERRPLGSAQIEPATALEPAPPAPRSTLERLDPRNSEIGRVLGALAVVIVLILALRMLLRRAAGPMAAGRPSGVLEILARYPVGRGQHLLLLKLARRVVLVHQAGTSMTTLTEIADPREVATLLGRIEAGGGPKSAFAQLLRGDVESPVPAAPSRPRLRTPAALETEIVDLTRDPRRVRRLLAGRGVA